MPAILAESDAFVDLTDPELEGRWLDCKAEGGTNSDGQLIGYGTDIGPEGICYRADLFEKAGLPTDREEVAALMATWDDYFALGEEFVAKVPDTAWYDSSGGLAQAMLNQVEYPFEERRQHRQRRQPRAQGASTTPSPATSRRAVDRHAQWSDDWTASFQNDGFATMACPGWMLGVIEGNAEGVEGWDIADVFPGGGGNWGGSYLTVPTQGEHPEEAKEFAAWLTAPEQQVKAFEAKGTFPSQVEALDDAGVSAPIERVLQRRPDRRDPRRTGPRRSPCSPTRARSTPTSCRRSRTRSSGSTTARRRPTSRGRPS